MKYKVWFEQKAKVRQYETITVGMERTIDTATENIAPTVAFNIVKALVFAELPETLKEARRCLEIS